MAKALDEAVLVAARHDGLGQQAHDRPESDPHEQVIGEGAQRFG